MTCSDQTYSVGLSPRRIPVQIELRLGCCLQAVGTTGEGWLLAEMEPDHSTRRILPKLWSLCLSGHTQV